MTQMHDVNERNAASAISDDDARGELARITSSLAFQQAPRLRQFLEYLVHETLNGRAARIKGFTIAQDVFGRDDPEEAQTSTIVSVQARRLRRRLDEYYAGDGKNDPVRIRIPKGAYVPVFEPISAEAVTVPFSVVTPKLAEPRRLIRDIRLIIALPVVLIVAGALLWFSQSAFFAPTASPDVVDRLSIAVLPFQNLTDDPGNDELALGLTEDLITNISKSSQIDVIAFSSVQLIQQGHLAPKDVGQELSVTHTLQGRIRGKTPKLQVIAELVETRSGRHIWSKRFVQPAGDGFALQDQLARNIAGDLFADVAELGGTVLEESQVSDPEVYTLYRETLGQITPQSDRGRNLLARQAFEEVVRRAPNFAGGYAGLAYTYAFGAHFGHSESPEADAQKALELADKAISIDDHHALAYSAKAFAHLVNRDFDATLAASTNAITLQPSAARSVVLHGYLVMLNGDPAQAVDYAKRALRLDPLAVRPPYLNILSIAYFQMGEYEKALQTMLRNAKRGGPQGPAPSIYLAAIYAVLGRHDEARAALSILNRRYPTFDWESWITRNFRYEEDAELALKPLRALAAE